MLLIVCDARRRWEERGERRHGAVVGTDVVLVLATWGLAETGDVVDAGETAAAELASHGKVVGVDGVVKDLRRLGAMASMTATRHCCC